MSFLLVVERDLKEDGDRPQDGPPKPRGVCFVLVTGSDPALTVQIYDMSLPSVPSEDA